MKTTKVIYWLSTSIVSLMMLFSAYAYLTQATVEQGFRHLGYPGYFRVELAIAKLIGAIVLLLPVSQRIKEWTYAGFSITFVSAFIAHVASGDPLNNQIMPLVILVILITSYVSYHKIRKPVAQTV